MLLAFIAAILGTEKKYSIFYKIFFIVGINLTLIASVLSFLVGPNLIDKIPLKIENFPEILAEEGSVIIDKVDIIAESIIAGLFQVTLMVGIIITVLSIVFWIISLRLSKGTDNNSTNKKS